MYINVIATIRNEKMKIIKYRLLDIEDNNRTLDATKEQIVSVLRSKKANIENIELVNGNTIRGKYYSLDELPKVCGDRAEYRKLVALCTINNSLVVTADVMGTVGRIDGSIVRDMLPLIMNVSPEGFKCPKREIKGATKNDIVKISDALNNKTKEKEIDPLDKEAIDKNAVWNLQTFDKFMKKHGYEYVLFDKVQMKETSVNDKNRSGAIELVYVSSKCKVLHLPTDIRYIYSIYKDNTVNRLEYLIIPETVKGIESIYENPDKVVTLEDKFTINHMHIQYIKSNSADVYIDFKGLENVQINSEVELRGSIKNFGNKCRLNKVTFKGEPLKIENSFCECEIGNNIIDLTDVINVENSFIDVKTPIKEVIFGDKLSFIKESFMRCTIENITFNKNEKCYSLIDSFTDIKGLKELDLSQMRIMRTIAKNSFMNLSELKKVIFSNYLVGIGKNCFSNCALDNVQLPNSLEELNTGAFSNNNIKSVELQSKIKCIDFPIFDKDTVIIFKGSNRTLDKQLLRNWTDEKLQFGETFSLLGEQFLSLSTNIKGAQRREVPNSIEFYQQRSFTSANLVVFDTLSTPKVTTIPRKAFAGEVQIQTLIINDNIISVQGGAFEGASLITRIVISGKAKGFESKSFSDFRKDTAMPIFYVVSSNNAAKKYLTSKKIDFIEIESLDEIYADINKDGAELLGVHKMLSGNDEECREFFEEPYVKNIDALMKLYYKTKSLNTVYLGRKELNTSKFKSIPLSTYPRVKEGAKNLFCDLTKSEYEVVGVGLSDYFVGLSNLFTTLFNNCMTCYKEEFIKTVNTVGNIVIDKIIAVESNSAIVEAVFSTTPDIEGHMLIIIMEDNIVFQTPFYQFERELICNSMSAHSLSSYYPSGDGLADIMSVGDSFINCKNSENRFYNGANKFTINLQPISTSLMDGACEVMAKSWKLIGIEFISDVSKYSDTNKRKLLKALFYDVIAQKLVLVDAKFTWVMGGNYPGTRSHNAANNAVNNYVDCAKWLKEYTIRAIYDLKDITKITVAMLKPILAYNRNKRINNLFELTAISKEEIDSRFSDTKQYDLDGNKQLIRLADILYKNDMKSTNEITTEIANEIIKTDFFMDYDETINYCDKHERNSDTILFKDGKAALLRYETNKEIIAGAVAEIVGIVTKSTSKTRKGMLKITFIPFEQIVRTLYFIGHFRANYKGTEFAQCQITNNKINIDKYIVLCTHTGKHFHNRLMKWLIALDKFNCDTYLLAEYADMDFYTFLRFKNVNELFETFNEINLAYWDDAADMIFRGYEEDDALDSERMDAKTREIRELRECIMNGFPNNYPYFKHDIKLFNRLSKQFKLPY